MAMVWPGRRARTAVSDQAGQGANPSNANRDLRATVQRADPELEWVTSHTFRKTVATRPEEAGLSARTIADHLGHAVGQGR
jgi:integrase